MEAEASEDLQATALGFQLGFKGLGFTDLGVLGFWVSVRG